MVKLRVRVGGSYTDLAVFNCNDELHPIEFDGPEFKGRAVVRIKDFGKDSCNCSATGNVAQPADLSLSLQRESQVTDPNLSTIRTTSRATIDDSPYR